MIIWEILITHVILHCSENFGQSWDSHVHVKGFKVCNFSSLQLYIIMAQIHLIRHCLEYSI